MGGGYGTVVWVVVGYLCEMVEERSVLWGWEMGDGRWARGWMSNWGMGNG